MYPILLKALEGVKHLKNNVEYLDTGVTLTFSIPQNLEEDIKAKIRDYSSGKSTVLKLETAYVEY